MTMAVSGRYLTALAAAMLATAAGATDCYGTLDDLGTAKILCSKTTTRTDKCQFLWNLTQQNGTAYQWSGAFQVQNGERNSIKGVKAGIAERSGNLNYSCLTDFSYQPSDAPTTTPK